MGFSTGFLMAIIFAVVGMVLQGVFIAVEHKEKYVAATTLKGLASVMFVTIGFLGYASVAQNGNAAQLSFANLLRIGLIFGLLGDVCLDLRFVFEKAGQKIFLGGVAMFLVGHILYLVALLKDAYMPWVCVAVGAVLAAGLLAYIFKTMEVKLAFKIFGIVYLGAVIIMTCVAIGRVIADPTVTSNLIYAIGAVLFTASDIILIFNTFSGASKFSRRICNLSLYYLGQLLIGGCLFFM